MRLSPLARGAVSALLAVAVLTAAGCGDDEDPVVSSSSSTGTSTTADDSGSTSTSTEPATTTTGADDTRVIEITVTGGEPEGGARTESVDVGDEVDLRVTSDVADEMHVHGYDLKVDLEPGVPTSLSFTADLPGRWEVELEDAGVELLQLEVRG